MGRGPDDRGLTGADIEAQAVPVEVPPAPEAPAATKPPTFRPNWQTVREWSSSGEDWLEDRPPAREYLLSAPSTRSGFAGMVPLGKVGMLAAGGGVGKTMALCQLAVAVAAGVPGSLSGPAWLGTYRVDRPGRVALLTGEEDAPELRRRLFQAAAVMNLSPDERRRLAGRLYAVPLTGSDVTMVAGEGGGWADTPAAAELLELLADGDPWSLVVVDPLSRFAGADAEKDNAAATRMVELCERLARAARGATVLVAHHTSQKARQAGDDDDATMSRGVTALTDGMRFVFGLTSMPGANGADGKRRQDRGRVVLRMTKNNYGLFPDPLTLVRDPDHGGALRAEAREERDAREAAEPKKQRPEAAPAGRARGRTGE